MVKETRLGGAADDDGIDASVQAYQSVVDVTPNDILHGVSTVLEHFIETPRTSASAFDSPRPSNLPIRSFLKHIMNSGLCSKECFVIALIYAERLLQRQPNMSICRSNVERLMLVSVMVASKILDDMYCRNVYYACAGGLGNKELNALEVQFCFLMDFDLNVNPAEFATYCSTLSRKPEKVTKPKFWGPSSPPAQPAQVVWGISVSPTATMPKPQHVAPAVGGMIMAPMPFPAIPAQAYHTQATHIIPQSTVHGQTIMGKPVFAPPYQPQPQLQPQPQVEQGHEAMSFSSAAWSPAWSLSSTSRPESPWSQGSGDEASQQPWSTGARPDWPQPADPLGAASAWFNTPAAPCGWPAASMQPTPIQFF